MRRWTAIVSIVGVAAVAGASLAGCGSAEEADRPAPDTSGEVSSSASDRLVEAGTPVAGGEVSFALEGETDGWDPTKNRWAAPGQQVGLALFDPLTALDDDGVARPYLARSIEPNDDYTVWTIVLRDGVTFHDGTPVTAAAVKRTMDAHLASVLTGPAIEPVEEVVVIDDRTAEVRMSGPWVAFPQVLTAQAGVIPAPAMLDDPEGSRHPVGSGPFRFQEWIPSNRLVVERNDAYWRTDASGQRLPYLDDVTFRPMPEGQTRINALDAGEVDLVHTSTPAQIVELERRAADGQIQLRNDLSAGEKGFTMLNLGKPPFDDPVARRAVVLATDVDAYNQSVNEGIVVRARSLFSPVSPFHSDEADAAWPEHDLEAARAAVAEWSAAHGGQPLAFTLTVPPTPELLAAGQTLQAQWQAAGMQVRIDSLEATAYVLAGVQGTYEAITWRQFGAADPDSDAHWWWSQNAAEIGGIGLNFARVRDDRVDALLEEGRTNPDQAARVAAYQDLSVRFNELMLYVWTSYARWVVAADDRVHQFWNVSLPDETGAPGATAEPISSGVFRLTETWVG